MRVYDIPIEEFDRDDLLHIAAMLYGCVEVRGYPHGCSFNGGVK